MRHSPLLVALLALVACDAPGPRENDALSAPEMITADVRPDTPPPPAAELERLGVLVGDWLVSVTNPRDSGRAVARGEARIEAILGGRYFAFEVDLLRAGVELRSRGYLGFDRDHELYQFLWLSELAPGMRVAEGRGDPRRGGLVLESRERDPESGALVHVRAVLRVASRDEWSLTQLVPEPDSADWIELRRTRYRRVRAAGEPD